MTKLIQTIDKIQQHSIERHAEYYRLVSELLDEVSTDTPTVKKVVKIIKDSLERTVKINDDYVNGEAGRTCKIRIENND